MNTTNDYQQKVRDAIDHIRYGPIAPSGQQHMTPCYTCPKCRCHAGTKMRSDTYWPPKTEMRCGWCHYTYPIPE